MLSSPAADQAGACGRGLLSALVADHAKARPSPLPQRCSQPAPHPPPTAQVRGRGLLNAVVIDDTKGPTAWDICKRLMEVRG